MGNINLSALIALIALGFALWTYQQGQQGGLSPGGQEDVSGEFDNVPGTGADYPWLGPGERGSGSYDAFV